MCIERVEIEKEAFVEAYCRAEDRCVKDDEKASIGVDMEMRSVATTTVKRRLVLLVVHCKEFI
jgi:hypothetical protein